MDQIKKLLANLSLGQKVSIVACALAVAAGLFAFARWWREGDFHPLYTSLAAEDAGAVVQKLKESGTDFRLADNGATVLVPSAKLPELRLQMALSGLPKTGRMGFELFDKTNFGVTDFAEHVNYRRALEGELERSIMSLAEVQRARVHLTLAKESVYLESRQPAKASVILGLHPGAQLSPQNVLAVCNLLASAVEGLAPEAVSVVDTRGNLLNRPRKSAPGDGLETSEANLEYREQVEKALLVKIQSTLEPLLGPDKFRAAVSAECDFSSGEQSEETFDPSRSVMVSSQKSEDVAPASISGGIPGTAANLPRPAAQKASGTTGASRRTEEINYQSSRLMRRVRLPEGELKRVSVSLLVDQDVRWEGPPAHPQQVLVPPTPERLKTIHDLVAGVIGFNAQRGDQLIVETLPFEATLHAEPPLPPAPRGSGPGGPTPLQWRNPKVIGAAAAGVILLLALGAGAMRLMRAKPMAAPETAAALPAGEDDDSAGKNIEAQLTDQAALVARREAQALEAMQTPKAGTNKSEVLTKHLRENLKKDPIAQVQMLRTWINEKS
jgi:flagellar M-ring protein FliF